ncbi:hypothetical protein BBJ29_004780 [Phytophthora kernoviae]|uniref:Uncharacterized protein n=1 Tax=Phytophthora kernoviae TaxID=325452 RepID=A0A3F2RSY4_9STRA|nr:hypothetical protein BBJ29_004780 [Phytophthora kernoviae]RLN63654.1 hypothetical protein BBP00_00003970 [Phytophthora kernoviae]
MGAVNCCAQTTPSAHSWKTGTRRRTLTNEEEERANMPMYSFEPSLSIDFEGRGSSAQEEVDDGIFDLGNFDLGTPYSVQSSRDYGDTSVVILSHEGVVENHDDLEEKAPPPPPFSEASDTLPTTSAMLLPAPTSCPQSGKNRRRQSPTFGSCAKYATTPRRAESFHEAFAEPFLEDYLCSCKYCPRAMSIKRTFQIYGFALDHPNSHSLMRVLRACANYDETALEIDPLILLHAEKMLEELDFDEDQTFRLLIASHFKPT